MPHIDASAVHSSAAKLWYLKRFPLFTGFTRKEMGEVERLTEMRRYGKGEVLYLPGQLGNQLFLIKSGIVKLSRLLADGRELTLALLKPGDVFGELEVIGDAPRSAQATAYGPTVLCAMQKRDVLRWMQRKPDLALRITKLIGLRRHVIERCLERLLFRAAPAKLAALLLDLATQFGRQTTGGRLIIDVPLTHQELANLTGSVRETVSDVLLQFRDHGLIAIDRRRIELRDRAALTRLAES